jgi:hypothetical protein
MAYKLQCSHVSDLTVDHDVRPFPGGKPPVFHTEVVRFTPAGAQILFSANGTPATIPGVAVQTGNVIRIAFFLEGFDQSIPCDAFVRYSQSLGQPVVSPPGTGNTIVEAFTDTIKTIQAVIL